MIPTRNATTVTCPKCGHTTAYKLSLRDLASGRNLTCGKCGKEIAFNGGVFEKAEEVLERLPLGWMMKTVTAGGGPHSLLCQSCGRITQVIMTREELSQKEKVFCTHCGKTIPINRKKLKNAQQVIERLGVMSDHDESETIDTPDGAISVTTKTFDVNVKTDIDPVPAFGRVPPTTSGDMRHDDPRFTPDRTGSERRRR